MLMTMPALLNAHTLQPLQEAVLAVHAAPPLIDYVQALVAASRYGQWFVQGMSPRAALLLLRVSKAVALIAGRDYVAPDDLQAIFVQTAAHRMVPVRASGRSSAAQAKAMMESIALP